VSVSFGSYLLGLAELGFVLLAFGLAALALRMRLLGGWSGAPARLIEAVTAIALLIWTAELLGAVGLLREWALLLASLLVALASLPLFSRSPAGGSIAGGPPSPPVPGLAILIAVGVTGVVVAHWGFEAKYVLDSGIVNFDSLWYHMPFAVDMAQSGSTTTLVHTDTVFVNWFYPQNSELVQAVSILLTGRDTVSLFLNFGWLALALLAAWCIGRPFGRAPLSLCAAAVLLECHTLVVREPGAAKNDAAAAALVLAAAALLINAAAARRAATGGESGGRGGAIDPGPALGAAGLAAGLAAGTKVTVLAPVFALTIAAVALAPHARRRAAAAWWLIPVLAGSGFWYLRNLIAAGNPIPQVRHLGPLSLPGPERLQVGRPDFNVLHYATDTGVWREYFAPGLDQAFGLLWPLVLAGALAGALIAMLRGPSRAVRWTGGAALFAAAAYLVTPLSAAGAEGAPVAFGINIRFLVPALLLGVALLPLAPAFGSRRNQWLLLGAILAVMVVTDRSDAVLRDPERLFGLALALLVVGAPAALLWARARGAALAAVLAGGLVLVAVTVAVGYPLQRDYLRNRFGDFDPSMHLDSAYRWANGVSDARIGLVGTTAGFLGYGFYGADLSNRVFYLGREGPHGAFNAIPTCRGFRAAVNEAELDYLVTAPFLNFIHPERPLRSPEATWLRGETAVTPISRDGPVTVWRVRGRLDPDGCSRAVNSPLRFVPDQPGT
jgi:hypothetical protein